MSVYNVNYLLRELLRDHAFPRRDEGESGGSLEGLATSPTRSASCCSPATSAGLHRLGVNDFLMGYLPRFGICGLDPKTYGERISKEAPR